LKGAVVIERPGATAIRHLAAKTEVLIELPAAFGRRVRDAAIFAYTWLDPPFPFATLTRMRPRESIG